MKIFLLITLLLITGCQNNKQNNELMTQKTIELEQESKLIDNLHLENNYLFDKNNILLKKIKYKEDYIENIKIKDLLDKKFRSSFIEYLTDIKTEEDELKSSFICQLLLLRIAELSDSNAFYILSEISKNETVSYNGIELYENLLIQMFLNDSYFFIQQSVKYNDSSLLNYILKMSQGYFIDEDFLDMNLGYIKSGEKDLLLLKSEAQKEIVYFPLMKKMDGMPKVKVQLGPSFYTNFETINKDFVNINSFFGKELMQKMNVPEMNYFKQHVFPMIEKLQLNSGEISNK
ncbi:hypothetical protein [Chryseobacterium sp. BIGb0232]|uniref:hypothetical protein n=1 Tax=Chryseobacterium sp. BIGb0232 TaxID=2940598 RepID=UPI000FBA61C5|nr:hypothetical protein [Chryseobacterium sp. BIGb0232]MCS4300626.1 hypothetical protein [Chryseobacterium sp. BIGb0232]ROS20489.1 hypothetical protein EDF65_1213 [Chryseobacterium nakagawai]